jgi:diadenosine tetraphosphatase ApaH/serine/threonine PP2A family protein phosphatase
MQTLIISDVHANLTALEAVLLDAGQVDAVWCLGDIVGYGPDPNQCVQRIQELSGLVCLLGNHDAAVCGKIDVAAFNSEARMGVFWTRDEIEDQHKGFLLGLESHAIVDSVYLAHGSPREPIWEYVMDTRTAMSNFDLFETPFCFVGHSHFPLKFQERNDQYTADLSIPQVGSTTSMIPRAIYNPGSVGQPRDRDPRAAYAIYDSNRQTWTCCRVAYDIPRVQLRMRAAKLPERHIKRLGAGW